MKKTILILIAVLLCAFSVVSAQETVTETDTDELNFNSVGDKFSWGMSGEEVAELLTNYDVEITVEDSEQYGKNITAEGESEDEYFVYVFYFDQETEKLFEVECSAAVYNSELLVPAFQTLYQEYGFADAEPYKNEKTDKYTEDFDESYVAAGSGTIAILAAAAETEESYGRISLVLIDREYFEK